MGISLQDRAVDGGKVVASPTDIILVSLQNRPVHFCGIYVICPAGTAHAHRQWPIDWDRVSPAASVKVVWPGRLPETSRDGVLHRGHELIPGGEYFIKELRSRDIPFLLLTNNSQRTRRDVVAKLDRLGIEVEDAHIFTSAMATARFLAQQKPGGTAFVIGEGGLLTALHENGYAVVNHEPDYVVGGEGRTFNLELVESAVRMILGGAKLIAKQWLRWSNEPSSLS